jgi:integrase
LAVLKSLFNRCRDDLRIYDGPTPRIKLLKESAGRLRFLDDAEQTALLAAAPEPLRTIILVGLHTGLRIKSEALQLQTADVDLVRDLVTVPAAYAKNGRSRTVPLNSTVRTALAKTLENRASGPVFTRTNGKPYRSIRKGYRLACEAAGLKDLSPHVRATRSRADWRWPASIRGRFRTSAAGGRWRWWRGIPTCRRRTRLRPSSGSRPRNSPTLFRRRPR